MKLLAHSARVKKGIQAQSYWNHISAVRDMAEGNMKAALQYRAAPFPDLASSVAWASEFHDLGKLEEENQKVLGSRETGRLPVNHVDAGTSHLVSQNEREAAIAVYGHHTGLCNSAEESAKDAREPGTALRDTAIRQGTDKQIHRLLALHRSGTSGSQSPTNPRTRFTGFDRRLLLSCLVDADHTDTARNYGEQPEWDTPPCRWRERLAALNAYVAKLSTTGGPRTELRTQIYEACADADSHHPIWSCDSPVGSGKTTAIMAYLLKAAIAHDLRHIFVVLPFTNIVKQSVDTYRRALVLPGEDPERVVAAHHHQADFKTPDLRYLTTLWDAPIIVTTAVQFFETLGSHQTGSLRKLHQLPGSAVFVDEAHAAMPIHIWPFMWNQIETLSKLWRCRFVLASGSLARFWENSRIMSNQPAAIPSMVPDGLRLASAQLERSRVLFRTRQEPLTLASLCDWVQQTEGSRLVVMNTVQSAAVLATELRKRGVNVLHISTALAPAHREVILRLVRRRLKCHREMDSVLVATSCVEAGVDFSFGIAFRERCRVSSLLQISGRTNRHGESALAATVWDFVAVDPLLTAHPNFRHTREVVAAAFAQDRWQQDPSELMTWALEEEFKRESGEQKIKTLATTENAGSYPEVSKLTKLIDADTRLVVVDDDLIKRIEAGEKVHRKTLIAYSVQMWFTKIGKLRLEPIGFAEEIYPWRNAYDARFTGIMAGVLELSQIDRDSYAII